MPLQDRPTNNLLDFTGLKQTVISFMKYFINEILVLFLQIYLQNYKTYQTKFVKKMREKNAIPLVH